jgi:hypothetical protein
LDPDQHQATLNEPAQMGGGRRRMHPGPAGQFAGGERLAASQRGEHGAAGWVAEQRRYRR